jgi:iron complex transport system substrate-binding protein
MRTIARPAACAAALTIALTMGACTGDGGEADRSFLQIGEFAIHRIDETRTEVRDGAGRILVLIPRGAPTPEDCDPLRVVRTPVARVVAGGTFEVAMLRALGVLDDVLVGVTRPADHWYVEEVRRGMKAGRIAYLGDGPDIDFERLRQQRPELVLTWDRSLIPMLDELKIPCAITSAPVAQCLNARMRFVQFLAPFFGRQREADAFFERVNGSLIELRQRTAGSTIRPGVMWGDIYEKRVLVEPGNAWVGELVELVESDYLFEDVFGTSCIEISVERFLHSGQEADIFFTYRTAADGVTSKAALARLNPLLAGIRPIRSGRVYAPRPHYAQSADRLDEILTEIAAILHPDVYPDYSLQYFVALPDDDPAAPGSAP